MTCPFTLNGQTSADWSRVSADEMPAALNSARGRPLMSGRPWRATHPLSPSPPDRAVLEQIGVHADGEPAAEPLVALPHEERA